jgi:uncharacterized protein YkwD
VRHAISSPHKLIFCIVAAAVTFDRGMADDPVDPTVSELLAAHNFIRRRNKLEPLKLSLKLCESAEIHARDMASQERMTHTGSDGSNPIQRARRVGYGSSLIGENIAVSQWTVEQVMAEWMESRGHRRNILGKYTEMGAARIEDELGNYFWCVNFGGPSVATRRAARTPGAAATERSTQINDEAAAAVVKLINRERETSGNVLLQIDNKLANAAMVLSAAMAAKDSLAVDGEPLRSIDQKVLASWEVHLEVGANIPTPDEAAKQLVGERAHELASFRKIGIGYALAKNGTPYWCAVFAKPAGGPRPSNPK